MQKIFFSLIIIFPAIGLNVWTEAANKKWLRFNTANYLGFAGIKIHRSCIWM